MSHGDSVVKLPAGFEKLASTRTLQRCRDGRCEAQNLRHCNFIRKSCIPNSGARCSGIFCTALPDWQTTGRWNRTSTARSKTFVPRSATITLSARFREASTPPSRQRSSRVPSAKQLTCVFVDHGLLRKDEAESVVEAFRDVLHLNVIAVDARERFLHKLAGVVDPEGKRMIIGHEFIAVFEEEAAKIPGVKYLVQGTLYPDVIESKTPGSKAGHKIKSHHNVGGLPEKMNFALIEPLRALFKDEVRSLGRVLGLPEHIVQRQPFPGPGLAVRIIGDITEERLASRARGRCDRARGDRCGKRLDAAPVAVFRRAYAGAKRRRHGRRAHVRQSRRRARDYERRRHDRRLGPSAARAARANFDAHRERSRGVNRVAYDITSKPPATVEWE